MSSKYDFNQLNNIRDVIERMPKFNQVEILRMLINKNVIVNENKYGIHINLSELEEDVLDELIVYIKYVDTQEIDLSNFEQEKERYKNIFFVKDNKEIAT